MAKVRVACFGVSIDGFGAGPSQSLDNPLGIGGPELMKWFFPTQEFQGMYGSGTGETGTDNDFAVKGFENVGSWILGRNMFGPIRGPWPNDDWKGWWGDEPPYHSDVYVLTHHPREPLPMAGGTTFHFVTEGIESALERALESAGGKDVRIGGGASTVRQYLQKGLIDELHLAQSPVLLGHGEPLFEGLNLQKLGYRCVKSVATERTTHLLIHREPNP